MLRLPYEVKDLFREYVRRGHTIMMSTHTLEVAEALCDRIAIIQNGKIRPLAVTAPQCVAEPVFAKAVAVSGCGVEVPDPLVPRLRDHVLGS